MDMTKLDTYQPHYHKVGDPIEAPKTRWIWNIFWILLGVTSIEVGFAFINSAYHLVSMQTLKVFFILLTLVKAYYIVFSYMHLGDEKKNFKLTISFSVILIIYFIVLMMIEGEKIQDIRMTVPDFIIEARSGGVKH
jgi:cytochrome c oxidase subunit IV